MAEPNEEPLSQVPHRELRDPSVLRALSHPVRLRILEELATSGPATATELAERVGESPANCSWHLRQLAQYGFIEEAGGGTGRQRPWKIVPEATSIAKPEQEEPEFATARDTLVEVIMGREAEAWRAWYHSRREEPPPWRDGSFGTSSTAIWLTAEELAALRKELYELLDRRLLAHLDRIEPANRPVGSRPIRFVAWAFPSGPPHGGSDAARDREPHQDLPPRG